MPLELLETQVAVVGAGAAGLYTALCAAREGAAVALISAAPLAGSSTYYAQGGLAAAIGDDDTPERHLADTLAAGRGAVRESAARRSARRRRPRSTIWSRSVSSSTPTSKAGSRLGSRAATAPGGSCTPVAPRPGQRLIRRLSEVVAEHPRSRSSSAPARWRCSPTGDRCHGLALADGRRIATGATVLATGGAAALWSRTTNPPGAIGGGLLLACAAGAKLADLELVQFHPTAVSTANGGDGLLVTEAVRGEGARLLDAEGRRFVDELAPRDEVARAVAHQLAMSGGRAVGLDMRAVDPRLFPNVVEALRAAGIDPERELVPVAPAAHYMMGGIATDLSGPLLAGRALRGRRMLLHRASRREPARVELALGVLRLWRARGTLGCARGNPGQRRPR